VTVRVRWDVRLSPWGGRQSTKAPGLQPFEAGRHESGRPPTVEAGRFVCGRQVSSLRHLADYLVWLNLTSLPKNGLPELESPAGELHRPKLSALIIDRVAQIVQCRIHHLL
jgi:hypothetical protein